MKKKRRVVALVAVFVVVIAIIVWWKSPKNYKKSYMAGELIEESYDKKKGVYTFSFQKEGMEHVLSVKSDYIDKRKLIGEMDFSKSEEGDAFCIWLKSEYLNTYPLCYENGNSVDYELSSVTTSFEREEKKDNKSEYKNITIYGNEEKSYLVWNHKGYYYIAGDKREEINLLEHESYYNSLAVQVGRYVLTPNYDEDYTFKTFFVTNMKNGKTKKMTSEEEISFNSYYLGVKDGIVYMVDRKSKKEYAINPQKRKIEVVDKNGIGKVYDGEWGEVSMTKLVGSDYAFASGEDFIYEIEDGLLYMTPSNSKTKMRVSGLNPSKIVGIRGDEVFYLVGSKLYDYTPYKGERCLMEYSEFDFNDVNSVFIY